jgi:hypothetical protein
VHYWHAVFSRVDDLTFSCSFDSFTCVSFAITFAVYFILLAFWSNEQERKIMTQGLKHSNKETLKRVGCCSTWHLGIADGFLCILLRRNFFYFALLFSFQSFLIAC